MVIPYQMHNLLTVLKSLKTKCNYKYKVITLTWIHFFLKIPQIDLFLEIRMLLYLIVL